MLLPPLCSHLRLDYTRFRPLSLTGRGPLLASGLLRSHRLLDDARPSTALVTPHSEPLNPLLQMRCASEERGSQARRLEIALNGAKSFVWQRRIEEAQPRARRSSRPLSQAPCQTQHSTAQLQDAGAALWHAVPFAHGRHSRALPIPSPRLALLCQPCQAPLSPAETPL